MREYDQRVADGTFTNRNKREREKARVRERREATRKAEAQAASEAATSSRNSAEQVLPDHVYSDSRLNNQIIAHRSSLDKGFQQLYASDSRCSPLREHLCPSGNTDRVLVYCKCTMSFQAEYGEYVGTIYFFKVQH